MNYTTAAGRTAFTSTRINAFGQTVHVFECDGCNGTRGTNDATLTDVLAREHADKCDATPAAITPADLAMLQRTDWHLDISDDALAGAVGRGARR